jgi:hypothetical protein
MNRVETRPFIAWPGWPHLGLASLVTVLVSLWFGLVYVGADFFTAHRASRMRVHLSAELDIPLIAVAALIYMSIYVLFVASPFVLRTQAEIKTLARTQAIVILIAGIGFLLIPAKLAYPPAVDSDLGIWKEVFRFADRLNLDYNLVPSLHVGLSIVCIELFAVYANAIGRIVLRTWGVLIAASTLFTHQHHLMDVVTGYLLALAIVQFTRSDGASKKVLRALKL